MGKRQPAGSSAGGNPPQGSKFGRAAGSAPAGAKKNPFDFFRHKAKHDVANARTRNVNVAKSRSQAIEKRMGTIGMELSQRHRTGTLVDRRFGEHDTTISKEDKMLIRFQRTRQKQLVNEKRQAYNLNSDDDDEDDEEVLLTHHGRTVDEMYGSNVPKVVLSDEESDDGSVDSFEAAKRDGGSKVDFGGMTLKSRPTMELDDEDDPNPNFMKSKVEVMSELISKSKAYRYEKQKELSERKDQVDALDEGFEELKELLGIDKQQVRAMKKQQRELSAMPEDDDGSEVEADERDSFDDLSSVSDSDEASDEEEDGDDGNMMDVDDDFDKMVKRLSAPGVRRAKPSNALLTEASIARAEQERLVQLEKQRLARMNATVVENGDDEIPRPAPSKNRGGDDLDDDFSRKWLPQDDDSDGSDDGSDDDEEDEEDAESGDDGSESSLDVEDVEEDYESKPVKRAKLEEEVEEPDMAPLNDVLELSPDSELPFTLAMPSDYNAFSTLISNQSAKRQAILISRLRACHHISLKPSNRSKLGQLLSFLYKRISDVGLLWLEQLHELNNPSSDVLSIHPKSKPSKVKLNETSNGEDVETELVSNLVNYLEVLVKPIFDLSTQLPEEALKIAKEELLRLEQAHLKNLALAAEGEGQSVVPSFPTLCFVQIMSIVFSASDRRHALTSPLLLHVLHVMGTCRMENEADVQRSVFLVYETLAFLKPAKRFAGEPFSLLFFILNTFLLQNNLLPKSSLLDQFNPILYIQPKSLTINDKRHSKEATLNSQTPLSSLVHTNNTGHSNTTNNHSIDSTSQTPTKSKQKAKQDQTSKNNGIEDIPSSSSSYQAAKDIRIIQAIHSTLVTLHAYLQLYSADVSAAELFAHSHRLLSALHDSFLPEATAKLRSTMIAMCVRVQKAMAQVRMPIQQFIKVIEALPALTPDFDDSYFGEKMTVDKVAKETQRMKRKIKSEQKGAEKELRKDTRFIQQLKLKQRGDKLAERKKTSNSTLAMLEQQQSEMNKKALSRKKR